MVKKLLTLSFLLFLSFFLYGNIYFWIDKDGTKHYSNTNHPQNQNVQELEESRAILKKITANKNKGETFKVIKIYDGDTIKVKGLGLMFKIRMVGIDSPEIGYKGQKSQPYSQAAKKYLTSLLEDKDVKLVSYGTGGYNRQLAEIFVAHQNINIKMIQSGFAEVYKGKRPKLLDSQYYLQEERIAKNNKKGAWAQGRYYKSPKVWRKEHPRK